MVSVTWNSYFIHGAPFWGAKGNNIVFWEAIHKGRRRIKRIAEVWRAWFFEHFWVHAFLACLRFPVRVPTTKHVEVERQTSALACDHRSSCVGDLCYIEKKYMFLVIKIVMRFFQELVTLLLDWAFVNSRQQLFFFNFDW